MRLASYWVPLVESAHAAFRQPDATAESVESQLKEFLDRASANAARDGYSSEQVQGALYATVAWLDELAMSIDWPGSSTWRLSPLQRHYFATTRAGAGFFDKLDALPEDAVEVREVYALMLVSGFQGEFSHKPAAELDQFRRELLDRVAREAKMAPAGRGQPLFPAAYVPGRQASLRRTRPLTATLLIVFGPLLVLLALYIYLDAQLSHDVAQLIAPLTKGL